VQPVDFHDRYLEQHTGPLTPMTNVVDYTVPDPLSRLKFAEEVSTYLHGLNGSVNAQQHAVDRAALENTFREWASAAHVLDAQASREPRLGAIAERRKQWVELANSGLEAISFIESGKPAPADWVTSRKTLIQQAGQPQELVDFVVLDPMDQLIEAAAGGAAPR